ncbi:5'-nucleotidase C-terminal domain-containing protein [Alkalimonas sp. MEB108]|uniref:5'-nucleotidase C-terminal domain-containing protein n=1 Tax=Alkalimonas cellulosilytica TaxID=3058395 RepID=A0ABU7J3I5_9GAMM|nr:5'-nucleotidase C-terminal domain-containing protein [Alkalimonas sp. MEB108]MEE2000592.1 5'-nucleotidase C-terminal domain-containing protein [Alkalimonas sp. MEB108]
MRHTTLLGCTLLFALTGCSQSTLHHEQESTDLTLAIAHINDHHSNLAAKQQISLRIAGEFTDVEVGGFPRVATKMARLQQRHPDLLKLHAGDAITGDLYYSLFQGDADAHLMREICFDAFTIGNHEFDDGDAHLAGFIRNLQDEQCQIPVLSANVRPEVGTPLAPNHDWELFQPYVIHDIAGHQVAIIGLTIAQKTRQSSQPLPSTHFLDELETARYYIDKLQQQGIGKIVLLTHYGYVNDILLAQRLPGVDVIVGGDSHSLLGDFAQVGLTADGDYPTMVTNLDGDPVCIVQGKDYAQVVGELVVHFRGDIVERCEGRPHLLVGDNFNRNGELLTGTERAEVLHYITTSDVLSLVEPEPKLQQLLEDYSTRIDELSAQRIAYIPERLCRMDPGEVREESCGDASQSDLHYVVSKAFLNQSRHADIALQNAGGVRTDLPAGELSIAQVYQLLPFSNTLIHLQMHGHEIRQVLEDAIEYSITPGASTGGYPHGAGIRFTVDMTKPVNQRVSALEVQRNGSWQPLLMDESYIVVTNSFIASGQDGWTTFGKVMASERYQDTYINYAQAFIDFAREQQVLIRPDPSLHSTQRIILP